MPQAVWLFVLKRRAEECTGPGKVPPPTNDRERSDCGDSATCRMESISASKTAWPNWRVERHCRLAVTSEKRPDAGHSILVRNCCAICATSVSVLVPVHGSPGFTRLTSTILAPWKMALRAILDSWRMFNLGLCKRGSLEVELRALHPTHGIRSPGSGRRRPRSRHLR